MKQKASLKETDPTFYYFSSESGARPGPAWVWRMRVAPRAALGPTAGGALTAAQGRRAAGLHRKSFLPVCAWARERDCKKEKSLVLICEIGSPGGNFNSCQMFKENAQGKLSTFADAFRGAPTPRLCAKEIVQGKSAGWSRNGNVAQQGDKGPVQPRGV